MTNRPEINKDFEMSSPLNELLNATIYVNIYGDSVVHNTGSVPLLFTEAECNQIIHDVQNIRIRISVGENPTFLENTFLGLMKGWY